MLNSIYIICRKKKYKKVKCGILCATYPLKYFRLNWHCLNTFNAKDVECYSTISLTRQLSSSIRCIHISNATKFKSLIVILQARTIFKFLLFASYIQIGILKIKICSHPRFPIHIPTIMILDAEVKNKQKVQVYSYII